VAVATTRDEGASNDYQDEYGDSPLHVACFHGLFGKGNPKTILKW